VAVPVRSRKFGGRVAHLGLAIARFLQVRLVEGTKVPPADLNARPRSSTAPVSDGTQSPAARWGFRAFGHYFAPRTKLVCTDDLGRAQPLGRQEAFS
jgi:hypothetical protein